MENLPIETKKDSLLLGNYLSFGIKSAILAFIAYILFTAMADVAIDALHDASGIPYRMFGEEGRIRLKAFLSANPAGHYHLAGIYEQKGLISAAVLEMELAVGLLEMHSSDRDVLVRYRNRLNDLREKEARNRS